MKTMSDISPTGGACMVGFGDETGTKSGRFAANQPAFVAALCLIGLTVWGQTGQDPCEPPEHCGGLITFNPDPPIVGEINHITALVANSGTVTARAVRIQLLWTDWSLSFGVCDAAGGGCWAPIEEKTVPAIEPMSQNPGVPPFWDLSDQNTFVRSEFQFVFPHSGHICVGVRVLEAPNGNDNPNNDWCHRNPKIIDAGPLFQYEVPIRNNTAQPLDVLVYQCPAGEAALVDGNTCCVVDSSARCDGTQGRAVRLPTGGEVLFPVAVGFSPKTQPGTTVDVVLGAIVLGPTLRNTPDGFSQVQLRCVFNLPRNLKQECLTMILSLKSEVEASSLSTGDKTSLQTRLDEIAGHLARSLDQQFWIDDFHLRVSAGSTVYAQEMAAAIKENELIMRNLPLAWKVQLDACTRKLVNADRIIAQTAIGEAGSGPNSPQAILFAEGDQLERGGAFADAISSYKLAWQQAVH